MPAPNQPSPLATIHTHVCAACAHRWVGRTTQSPQTMRCVRCHSTRVRTTPMSTAAALHVLRNWMQSGE